MRLRIDKMGLVTVFVFSVKAGVCPDLIRSNSAMDSNQLDRQIERAFSEYPLPDRERLTIEGRWFDENGERHEYANLEALDYQTFFQGKSWHVLVDAPLINWGAAAFSALSFLNVRARAYYLPAYMLTAMHNCHENFDLVEGLFNNLTPIRYRWFGEDQENKLAEWRATFRTNSQADAVLQSLEGDFENFLDALTPFQKTVIRDFILYMRNTKQAEGLAEIALKTYWNKVAS
jgi:hypothetical protein